MQFRGLPATSATPRVSPVQMRKLNESPELNSFRLHSELRLRVAEEVTQFLTACFERSLRVGPPRSTSRRTSALTFIPIREVGAPREAPTWTRETECQHESAGLPSVESVGCPSIGWRSAGSVRPEPWARRPRRRYRRRLDIPPDPDPFHAIRPLLASSWLSRAGRRRLQHRASTALPPSDPRLETQAAKKSRPAADCLPQARHHACVQRRGL